MDTTTLPMEQGGRLPVEARDLWPWTDGCTRLASALGARLFNG
jgi:hypothetical protein